MYRIGPIGRKPNFHSREKCLIGLVLATLCLLCFAGIFLLPDNFGGERVLKVYKSFQKAGPEIFIPAPPLAGNGHGGKDLDPHVIGDRVKLQAKIKEELGDILDKPEILRRASDETIGGGADPGINENVGVAPVIENDLQSQQQQQQLLAMQQQQQHQVVGALPPPALRNALNDDGQEMLPVGDVAQLQMPMDGHPDPNPSVEEKRMKVKEALQTSTMCSTKCCRMPTLLVIGITITIVLVFITGITLTNSLNISNIIKLREKVASDSVSASAHNHQGRDYNLLATNHPKNLNRNKIVIEIGLRNYSESSDGPINAAAIGGGNVDSIVFSSNGVLMADASASAPAPSSVSSSSSSLFSESVTEQKAEDDEIGEIVAAVLSNNHRFDRIKPVRENRLDLSDSNPAMIDFEKREVVKKMMIHAWQNYKLYAWGKNELRPLSQRAHSGSIFGSYDLGATIVDGLDTLYLMGLEKEYREGRDWIERKFSLDNISADLSVFETNIRFVGGLLTLYAFTGDPMYKEKAQHIADKLLPAFQTPTGIPYALVNVKTGMSKNYGWASGGSSILSEFGTLHLEFSYLSDITGNPLYRERVQTIRQVLKEIEKPKGLYPNYLNPKTGKWGQLHMSLGALGDSFYEYLLKAWLQSGQTDEEARQMFDEAMTAIIQRMVMTSPSGLTYVTDMKFDRPENKMDHLACFAGGLFALGANTRQNEHTEKFMEVGKGLTNTCHESYIRTPTKLGPEAFRFGEAAEARALKSQEKYYILRPETFESYFVLWRLTHDQKYRDWGWEAVEALEKHCRTPHGYSGLKNVYQDVPQKDDVQQSFFLAETLKYLYLLFSDDSLLPLDEWVFNTEAHPLPIKGANIYYRMATTSSSVPSSNTP